MDRCLQIHFSFSSELSAITTWRVYQCSNRIKNRVAPPETAPKVAPFLPPMAAPIAVAMPAVAAIRRVSFSQDRRFPPPHNTIAVFICTSRKKFPVRQARRVPHAAAKMRLEGGWIGNQVNEGRFQRGFCGINCRGVVAGSRG